MQAPQLPVNHSTEVIETRVSVCNQNSASEYSNELHYFAKFPGELAWLPPGLP